MPLSTAQALAQWEGVVTMLAAEKARAAAHPEQPPSPDAFLDMMQSLPLAMHELAAPAHTWKALLQKQVPRRVLAGCCELPAACFNSAVRVAKAMFAYAASSMQRAVPGSSSRKLLAMLWEQVEQSGFLQQLSAIFSSQIQAVQTQLAAEPPLEAGPDADDVSGVLFSLLVSLEDLQPLETHAAGLQCLVPAMQLVVLSLQSASKSSMAMSELGGQPQPWMDEKLELTWRGLAAANTAASRLLAASRRELHLAGQSSSGGSGRGGADRQAVAHAAERAQVVTAMLHAEATVQCFCLTPLLIMLVQHLQQTNFPPEEKRWLPAALAPSLPAAYSTMLEQLGCSREVGLWVAAVLSAKLAESPAAAIGGQGSAPGAGQSGDGEPAGTRAEDDPPEAITGFVSTGLGSYCSLLATFAENQVLPPKQLAPLQLSLPAITLQWLLGLPPATLLHMGRKLVIACAQAARACSLGLGLLMQHKWQPADFQPRGAMQQVQAGSQTAAVLGTAVLDKLFGIRHALPVSEDTTSSSSDSGSSSNTSSSASPEAVEAARDTLLHCCRYVVELVTRGLAVEAEVVHLTAAWDAAAAALQPQQLPVGYVQLCKLLQEFVRGLVAEATTDPLRGTEAEGRLTGNVLQAVHFAFFSGSPVSVAGFGGPLVAHVVAAGDPGSPDALELFGLLCSVLKAILLTPRTQELVPQLTAAVCAGASQLVVKVALQQTQTSAAATLPGSGSGSPCVVALPWLVLLGRCCLACAILVQHWQHIMQCHGGGAAAGTAQHVQPLHCDWPSHWQHIVATLKHLQPSLTETAQWLTAAGPAQQLAALGYQPLDLQQQLAAAAGELPALCRELEAVDTAAVTPAVAYSIAIVLKSIQQHLQAAAGVLSTFATPHACNNPRCLGMSFASEARLVGGRRCICAGCRTARYCGRECQSAAWRAHKPVCRALAAAAAAGTGGAAEAAAEGDSQPAG